MPIICGWQATQRRGLTIRSTGPIAAGRHLGCKSLAQMPAHRNGPVTSNVRHHRIQFQRGSHYGTKKESKQAHGEPSNKTTSKFDAQGEIIEGSGGDGCARCHRKLRAKFSSSVNSLLSFKCAGSLEREVQVHIHKSRSICLPFLGNPPTVLHHQAQVHWQHGQLPCTSKSAA